MRTMVLSVVLVAGSSIQPLSAQNVTMTIEALPGGNANAYVSPSYAPTQISMPAAPVGSVAPGVVFGNLQQWGNSYAESVIEVRDSVPNQVAPFACAVESRATGYANPPAGLYHESASSTMDLAVRITLTANQSVTGRLLTRWRGQACDLADASVRMDIGADGTIETQSGNLTCAAPVWTSRDLLLTVGPQPLPIEFVVHNDAGASAVNGSLDVHGASLTLECHFFPGQPLVEPFDTTGANAFLGFDHRPDGRVDLYALPPGQPSVFAFGTSATVVPWTPTLTQLVTIDAFAVADTLQLPLPLLPPGSQLFCQGLVVSVTGELLGTRSLRAIWP